MDEGRFERSRLIFWAWLVTPAVLILAAMLPSYFLMVRTQRTLAERKSVLQTIAPMEDRLRMVNGILASLTVETGGSAQAADEATRRIYRAAQERGFTIRSLNVEKTPAESGGLKVLRISVQGEGSLPAIVNWLGEFQWPGLPLRVEAAKVTCLSLPPDNAASGEFTLALYLGHS